MAPSATIQVVDRPEGIADHIREDCRGPENRYPGTPLYIRNGSTPTAGGPGSLERDETPDIVAYVLEIHGFLPRSWELRVTSPGCRRPGL